MLAKEFNNIREIINNSAEKYPDNNAFIVKNKDMKTYTNITYRRLREEINGLGTALLKLGLNDLSDPASIQLYPKDFESKDVVVDIIDDYNSGKSEEEKEALLHKNEPQYDTQSDEPVFCMSFGLRDLYPDEELPFQ